MDAIYICKPCGTIVEKTTTRDKSCLDLSAIVVNEIRIIGSRCGEIGMAIDWLKTHSALLRKLVEAVYPFSRFQEAFEHALRPGTLKVLISF